MNKLKTQKSTDLSGIFPVGAYQHGSAIIVDPNRGGGLGVVRVLACFGGQDKAA